MSRWKMTVAFDGTDFEGWQSQPSGNTVQDHLEARLKEVVRTSTRLLGSSRTDSGVHADGLVAHFDTAWTHGPARLVKALHAGLPETIRIVSVRRVRADFHARFDAKGKRYRYRLVRGRPPPREARFTTGIPQPEFDLEAVRQAAQSLLGKHDFTAYAAVDHSAPDRNPVKDLRRLDVVVSGSRMALVFEADAFLYKMVRSLAGALINVGLGRLAATELVRIRDSKERTALIPTAPAKGLCLERVFY